MNAKVRFAGITFDNVTMSEAIDRIDDMVRHKLPKMIVTANVDHILRIRRDRQYAALVSQADMVLADGQPIVWATRFMGDPIKERVAGSDLFRKLCEHSAKRGYRVFLLGGDPGVADAASRILKRQYPGLQIVGTYCPQKGFEQSIAEDQKANNAVRSACPDLLFVGLGSPKQEKWIAQHMHEDNAVVSLGIGISFSFVSGHISRAPLSMQRLGLEWLYRLWSEPGRLWRRYLIRGPAFLPLVVREMIHSRLFPDHSGHARPRYADSRHISLTR